MKSTNLDPSGDLAAARWRGHIGSTRAGSGGVTVTDSTTTIDDTTTFEFSGVTVTDNGDGTTSVAAIAEGLLTNQMDTSFVLSPDGSGGVQFREETVDTGFLTRSTGGEAAITTVTSSGAALTLDLSLANHFHIVLDANCTITFSNPPSAGVFSEWGINLVQGGAGGFTVTWPASVSWRGTDGTPTATAPALATAVDAQDAFTLNTQDGGTTYGMAIDNGGASASALDDLTDVTITSPASGQKLRYDGSVWVNANLHDEPMIATDGTVMLSGLLDPMMHEVAW